jgi:serine phosphatase RsbU (regulator of sigma subunit)
MPAYTALKKLFSKNPRLKNLVSELSAALDPTLRVVDADGALLLGPAAGEHLVSAEVVYRSQPVGWVEAARRADEMAGLLNLLLEQEDERKNLAQEVLDRYRELNLLYNISEDLAASPLPEAMAGTILREAGRLIQSETGIVVLVQNEGKLGQDFTPIAGYGPEFELCVEAWSEGSLIRRVLSTRKAALENSIPADAYFCGQGDAMISIMCAPLKTEKRTLGAMLLVRNTSNGYTAGDLKLLSAVALQAAPAIEVARLYQVAIENARLERELQMARQVQADLLPAHMPRLPGWEFAAGWSPAREVSGDYYDLFKDAGGRMGIVIADVADKGMPASLFMVFTRSAIRATLHHSPSTARGIRQVNQLMCAESSRGYFVTVFFARLDPQKGEITYVNAGHNPPILVRAADCQVEMLTRTGMALGILEDADYEQRTIQLEPGDLLLLYTDGLTEAMNASNEQFGTERLIQLTLAYSADGPQALLAAINRAVNEFTNAAPQADDITLLAIKRVSKEASDEQSNHSD